jgi:hypothetical protein
MSTLPSVVSRFVEYYAALDSQPPSALVGLYHSNATLIDPFGEHDGIFALQRYFTHLLANVEHCRFTIDTPLCSGNRFAVTWVMHWSHPRIAGESRSNCRGVRWWRRKTISSRTSATTTMRER